MDSLKVQAIQAIADAHGGHITPEMVIEAARDKRHPLHNEFDWNVKSAAHKHWQNTARHIIRSVKIVYRVEHKNVTAVAYARDPDADSKTQGYISVASIRSDEDVARDIVIAEFKRVRSALKRARDLANVLGASDDIDELLTSLDGLEQRLGVGI